MFDTAVRSSPSPSPAFDRILRDTAHKLCPIVRANDSATLSGLMRLNIEFEIRSGRFDPAQEQGEIFVSSRPYWVEMHVPERYVPCAPRATNGPRGRFVLRLLNNELRKDGFRVVDVKDHLGGDNIQYGWDVTVFRLPSDKQTQFQRLSNRQEQLQGEMHAIGIQALEDPSTGQILSNGSRIFPEKGFTLLAQRLKDCYLVRCSSTGGRLPDVKQARILEWRMGRKALSVIPGKSSVDGGDPVVDRFVVRTFEAMEALMAHCEKLYPHMLEAPPREYWTKPNLSSLEVYANTQKPKPPKK